jgi:tripartite-type tricarboxylate transporter receptor subunit TctC
MTDPHAVRGIRMRFIFGLIALALLTAPLRAQAVFPSRVITVIVPFSAGGSVDIVARVLAEGLNRRLGQNVVVDNRPGGSGSIGTKEAAKAAPDGHTLLLGSVGVPIISSMMNRDFGTDPEKELTPVSNSAEFVIALLVQKELPVNTLQEFVAYAKARPGQLNYGTSGVGTLAHLAAELLIQRTGILMQHVPYRTVPNMLTDLAGGNLDAMFSAPGLVIGFVESKRAKVLAVSSTYRLNIWPGVPTVQESGIANFDVTGWMGVFAPAGLPADIRSKLSAALTQTVKDPVAREQLQRAGFEPVGTEWDVFQKFVNSESHRWRSPSRNAAFEASEYSAVSDAIIQTAAACA